MAGECQCSGKSARDRKWKSKEELGGTCALGGKLG